MRKLTLGKFRNLLKIWSGLTYLDWNFTLSKGRYSTHGQKNQVKPGPNLERDNGSGNEDG